MKNKYKILVSCLMVVSLKISAGDQQLARDLEGDVTTITTTGRYTGLSGPSAQSLLWAANNRAANLAALRAMAQLNRDAEGSSVSDNGDGDGTQGQCAGNPIMIATGNKVQFETDYIGKGEFPLSIERTYNNAWTGKSFFGDKWINNYGHHLTFTYLNTSSICDSMGSEPGIAVPESCEETGDSSRNPIKITAHRPDGKKVVFTQDAAGNWVDKKTDSINTLVKNPDGSWTLETEALFTESYNSKGFLTKRANSEGIYHAFTYVGDELYRVTHTNGRYLQFAWSGGKVIRITDTAGNEYNYGYRSGYLGSVIYPGGNDRKDYYYNNSSYPGALTQININGTGYAYFTYGGDGKATSSYHAGDVDKYTFQYSAENVLGVPTYYTDVINPLGGHQKYGHNMINGVKKFKAVSQYAAPYCAQASRHVDYDANGYEDIVVDWKGNKTDYDYDDSGQLIKKTVAKGTAQEKSYYYTWVAGENRLTKLVSDGLETNYSYSAAGRIKSITYKNLSQYGITGETRTTSYTYTNHSNGILSKVVLDGPRTDVSDTVTMNYDNKGNLISLVNALGHTTTYSNYDLLGNVGRITSANGLQVNFTYNPRGWVLTKTVGHPAGNQTTEFEYNAMGQITTITYPTGRIIRNYYTPAYRLDKTTDGEGNRIKYEYNNNGDVISQKIQNVTITSTPPPPECWGGGTLSFLANRGQVAAYGLCEPTVETTITDYNARYFEYDVMGRLHSRIGNGGQKVEYMHDKNSNIKEVIDSYGRITRYTHDALNRVSTVTDPQNNVTSYTYDAGGRIKTVTDARGMTTTYNYSGFGELEELMSPDTGTTSYDYNQSGQVTRMVRNNGTVSTFTYDKLGRIKTESHGATTKAYAYDAGTNRIGRLYYVNDASGQTVYWYDSVGNVTRKRSKINDIYYNTYYSYDGMNRLTSVTYPSGRKATYTYDSLGRVTVLSYVNGGTTKTVASNLKYRPFGPLSELTHGNGAIRQITHDLDYRPTRVLTSGIQDLRYLYDKSDNITKITNGVVSGATQTYAYDAVNRLKSVTGYKANTYTYDGVGNRKSQIKNGSTETYNYSGSSNQLVSVGGSSISYNANGQTQSKLGSSFSYDDENRLAQHIKNGQSTNYSYNALGQRVNKTNSTANTRFFYDESGKLIAEYSVSDNKWKEYIYLHGQVVGFAVNGALYYVHNDHLGRAERITNASKSTVWRANNHDFDRVVAQNNIGDYNLGFPGQYYDSEKGSYYNYFRDYDPKTGRYIQSDPIGLAGGINTYGYVGGNPVNWFDPFGLEKCSCKNWGEGHGSNNGDTDFNFSNPSGADNLGPLTQDQANLLNGLATSDARLSFGTGSSFASAAIGAGLSASGATAGVSILVGGGLAVISWGASYFISDNPYQAGYTYLNIHHAHDGHSYTRQHIYDQNGNQISSDITKRSENCW